MSLRGEETLPRQLSAVKECNETGASAGQVPGAGEGLTPDTECWLGPPAACDEEI